LQREEKCVRSVDSGVSDVTHHLGDKDENLYSSCDEYDVDFTEEPPQSTTLKNNVGAHQPAVQIRQQYPSSRGNRKRQDKHSTETPPSNKETKESRKRKRRTGQSPVDEAVVEGTQRVGNPSEVLINAIPDMNTNQTEVQLVANQLTVFNHVSTSGTLQHQGDAPRNFISPTDVVNNYNQVANETPSSIYMGDQPLACESSGYTNSWSENTFQPNVYLGSIGFSSSSLDYQTSAAKQSVPISMDNNVPGMGTDVLVENSSFSHHMAGSGNSTSVAGDTNQMMSDDIYFDPDKFIGSSFDGLPLDFIGINSPIPDLDELLDDDDLMQYLGT
jgi:ethylene-insensitive protein 3